jgi:hypothetical protein
MEVAVAYPISGQAVKTGRIYIGFLAPEVTEARIVTQDEDDIGASLLRAGRHRSVWR